MYKWIAIIFVVSVLIIPTQVKAADFDGSSPLLCAVIKVFECDSKIDCKEGDVDLMSIPQFLRIDIKNKKVTLPKGSKEKRESVIKHFEDNDGQLILQGTEEGLGWSILINQETGKMSGTASEDAGGFVIFGACTLD